jgi:hypothetical protein
VENGPAGRIHAQLLGSGTFIRIGDISGIITAQHVTQLIEPSYELGLIVIEQEHKFTIPYQHLSIVNLADGITPGQGPDLSFVRLHPNTAAQISPYKSFWNLAADKDIMLTAPPALDAGAWFVCGTPDELTQMEPSATGRGQVVSLGGYCGVGGPESEYETDGYDYLDMTVEYKEGENIPTSFGGISGGGLWQVKLKGERADQLEPIQYLYSGVPFYQSALRDNRRIIKCHGRRSIYNSLFERITHECA